MHIRTRKSEDCLSYKVIRIKLQKQNSQSSVSAVIISRIPPWYEYAHVLKYLK
jgi:hypothetical protein